MQAFRGKLSLVLSLLVFMAAAIVHAQTSASTGAIKGTVHDAHGAVLVGSTVHLTNSTISLQRDSTVKPDGTYVFPLLQPATGYRITIEKEGFDKAVIGPLTVNITETTNANVTLSVGMVSQQVSVESQSESIQTTSSTLGRIVEARVITSLPLPTRNVLDLMSTDAGVAATLTSPASTITQGSNTMYVAGSRATSNNYLLNGVDSNNFEFQTLAPGVVPIPSPDSVQEFKTQTSLYDATTGYSSGGNINLVTRAGTNQFHGSAYEFLRNTSLNANDYILKRNGVKRPILQQNLFGATLGGPVHLLNSFFFVNYEGMRQKNGVTGSVSGPFPVLPSTRTAATLASAFGLDASNIDPVALNLLNAPGPYGGLLFPSGTGASVGQIGTYSYSKPVTLNSNQVSSRIDLDFKTWGKENHFTGTGFVHDQLFSNPTGDSGSSLGQPYSYPLGSQNATLTDTTIFSPNLINEVVYGYNWNRRDIIAVNGLKLSDVGITRSNSSVTDLLPDFSITNQMSAGGYTANVQHPQHAASFDFRDTLTWIHGRHSVRTGFEARREQFNDGIYLPRGSLAFQGKTFSSNSTPFQDFLTGTYTSQSYIAGTTRLDFRARDYIAFVQDDYRLRPRFTLNLGLRYDHLGNPWEIKNLISNFDPSLLSPSTLATGGPGLKEGFVVAGQNGVSRSTMLRTNYGSWSPRIGFAWDVFGNSRLAVRGGFGLYYQATGYSLQFANSGNPPFQVGTSSTNSAKATQQLADPFPVLPLPNQFPQDPAYPTMTGINSSGAPIYSAPQLAVKGIDRNIRNPYSENWNFTIEDEFIRNWTVEIGYLGNHGVRQTSNTQQNNSLLVNSAAPGRFGLTANSSVNRDTRVPIAGLSAANGFANLTNNAQSFYHAFIVTLNHRFSEGFLIKAAYTRSKTIDDYQADPGTNYAGSALGNPYSLALNKGISAQDIPNRLVITFVWDIPGFKHGYLSYPLAGWAVSGINTFQNGQAGVVTQTIGNGSFDGSAGYGYIKPGCKLVASGPVQAHLKNYLNPSCATLQPLQTTGSTLANTTPQQTPGNGSYPVGTGGGYLIGQQTRGAFYAPYQSRSDLTLSKNFPLRVLGDKGNLEFRGEVFKLLNNAIFAAPNAAAITPYEATNLTSGTFGTINSTIDNTGRQFQFALKASF
jgi:hypothetical protein